MILAGDIGGTKTNLALFKIKEGNFENIYQHQFVSKKYESFDDILIEFEELVPDLKVDAVCIGVAGAIVEQKCKTTNLPWDIDAKSLKKYFKTEAVRLLNDLEATAYGMLYLKEEEFLDLNPGAKNIKGNIAVIAAGTGLGEAILYFDGELFTPIGTEGGHSDFAPVSALQDELLLWLREKYPKHVSYERVVSGMGLNDIYEFLLEKGPNEECEEMEYLTVEMDKNAMISKCAIELKDPLCKETLKLFAEIYAAEAGNLALKSMALGGVYIGGGIAPKILPFIKKEYFFDSFVGKGRFEELLRTIPLKVSLNQETALLGAGRFALDKLL